LAGRTLGMRLALTLFGAFTGLVAFLVVVVVVGHDSSNQTS
jgi:hypothetical protein